MSSYSSEKFFRDWRFSIGKDFVDGAGKPFVYADKGLKEWGDEDSSVTGAPYGKGAGTNAAAISDDGQTIAVAIDQEINVYSVTDSKQTFTLQGHLTAVSSIAFVPGHPKLLVSYSADDMRQVERIDSQIIFWDLKHQAPNKFARPEIIERLSRNAANTIVADMKQIMSDVHVDASEQKELAKTLVRPIRQFVLPKGVAENVKLHGRLLAHFGTYTFNRSGSLMLYLPGESPASNGHDDWEVRVYSLDRHEDALTLKGHYDMVVWTGFNPDETLIGTVSWDTTMRIWNVKDGTQKYEFTTKGQNWTAEFSPNGKYFAGTSGDGILHLYDLEDGTERMNLQASRGWCRTLSWHPSSQLIAMGYSGWGTFMLVDVDKQEVIQHRKLDNAAMKLPKDPNFRDIGGAFLEVTRVAFVDDGRKIAFITAGDGSAEVYDLEQACKWRFARAGTMSSRDTEVNSRGGFAMLIHEDKKDKKVVLATLDEDVVRFWHVPMIS